MKNIRKRPFNVYLPGTKNTPPKLAETIEVEVYDNFGEEFLTQESREEIERVKARHLGLMSGPDIKSLRKRHGLTQSKLAFHIGCGEKSVPRWENGNGYPSGLVNKMLRLLDEDYITISDLESVSGPRKTNTPSPFLQKRKSNIVPFAAFKNRLSKRDVDSWVASQNKEAVSQ